MGDEMQLAQIQTLPVVVNVLKVLMTGFLAFVLAFLITPLWTHILYKYRFGIKIKSNSVQGDKLTYVSSLHAWKANTPTMGGVIIWSTVLILAFASEYLFPSIAILFDTNFIARLDFLSRSQTWLPLAALVSAGVLGLFDDYMSVRGCGTNKGGGMRFSFRFWWLFLIAGIGAWWFYSKLDWNMIHVPALGDFQIGWWYIPLFLFVILFSAISSNETDGLDGLNAGVLLFAFFSFAIIAFLQNRVD
ncbi:MAG: Phospho-N-acetylmuramoyl-pentapeptide-transferase, partial [Patescibacteria group bacterium]|nr:Phospho-N-acetylmuramoyl-pentapeptide-transferase [Patescibacteria group bacterium]